MAQDGYAKVTNILNKEDVVTIMKEKYSSGSTETYAYFDIHDLSSIGDKSVDLIIDNALFDTLHTEKEDSSDPNIDKYLNEVLRVLKPSSGRFVCLTLCQPHIIKKFINFFLVNDSQSNAHFDNAITELKVNEIQTKSRTSKLEQQFIGHRIPFMISVKRTEYPADNVAMSSFKANFHKMISVNSNLLSHEDAKKEVLMIQMLNLQHGNIKELIKGRTIELNLESAPSISSSGSSKFKLILVDSLDEKVISENTCAILITPQGKETYPVYSTEAGFKELSEKIAHSRLIIVHLKSGHLFEDFDTVKKELESTIVKFAQHDYKNEIPYISEGKNIGKRAMVSTKHKVITEDSKYDPDQPDEFDHDANYVIEDLIGKDDKYLLRILKFKTKLGEIQSDVKIFKHSESKAKADKIYTKVRSPLWTINDGEFLCINHHVLNSEYLCAMMTGMTCFQTLFEDLKSSQKSIKCSILGTGAGLLPMFLKTTMSNTFGSIDTVDIDEEIVTIGKDYFGFNITAEDNIKSHIIDANNYLTDVAEANSINVMLVDLLSPDVKETTIPPRFVIGKTFMNNLIKTLDKDNHLVCMNTCCYREADYLEISKFVNTKFKFVSYINCTEASNRVYIMSNSHAPVINKNEENTIKQFVKSYCNSKTSKSFSLSILPNHLMCR